MTQPLPIEIVAAAAHLPCADISAVLREIAARAHATRLAGSSIEFLTQSLAARESMAFTSTAEGVAFPHAIRNEIAHDQAMALVLTLSTPVVWGPHRVKLVVALFGSPAEPWRHVRMLARAARVCIQADARQRLSECATDQALLDLFTKECNSHG